MRTIKFRGKANDGRWVYGSLVQGETLQPAIYFETGNGAVKTMDFVYVDPETVGESSGHPDINKKEIFEGDIIKWGHIEGNTERQHRVAVVEMFPSLQFRILHYIDPQKLTPEKGDGHVFRFGNFIYTNTDRALEVIGNIHDNPELLEVGA